MLWLLLMHDGFMAIKTFKCQGACGKIKRMAQAAHFAAKAPLCCGHPMKALHGNTFGTSPRPKIGEDAPRKTFPTFGFRS